MESIQIGGGLVGIFESSFLTTVTMPGYKEIFLEEQYTLSTVTNNKNSTSKYLFIQKKIRILHGTQLNINNIRKYKRVLSNFP